MTRINLVHPTELSRQHLVAEYRELPRIFALVKASQSKGLTPSALKVPNQYVLGRGHMIFFYDKCAFLLNRQRDLITEMLNRGYDPKFRNPEALVDGIACHWLNDYTPTDEAIALNRHRIAERTA
jgi:deoxyribonuclease (pyrimidine dimer)